MTSILRQKLGVPSPHLTQSERVMGNHQRVGAMALPKVFLVGGPDVDARILLMQHLEHSFAMGAIGSSHAIAANFKKAGFTYDYYPLTRDVNPIADIQSIRCLASIFRQQKPKIVHAFDTKPGVWGCLAARMAGVPIVIGTVTGFGGSLHSGAGIKARTVWRLYQTLQKWASHQSDMTIFQNHEDHDDCLASGIVPVEKATVILGSGVQTERFSPKELPAHVRTDMRQKLGIQPDELVVTMISRVIRSKGVMEFTHAAQSIGHIHPKVRFLLVGDADEENLDRLNDAELAELRENLIWPGYQSDIPAVLAAADIFVLPTTYREGIPRVLLEAASMGLPIVTTNTPGCNDVVQNGVNGILTPIQDANAISQSIQTLVEQPELRRQYGLASRKRAVERFDLVSVANQTSVLYERLLKRKDLL